MQFSFVLFFSRKYWPAEAEIAAAAEAVRDALRPARLAVVIDGDLSALDGGELGTPVVVPMSGSVQPDILHLAAVCRTIVLFAPYVRGTLPDAEADRILCRNAAPTVAEIYGVLRRGGPRRVLLARTAEELRGVCRALEAAARVRGGTILQIGAPEPWVLSPARDPEAYARALGIRVATASARELIARYEATSDAEAEMIRERFVRGARRIDGPRGADIARCARMAHALAAMLGEYRADGLAIACFHLIAETGVNPCLGVSYINGETDRFAACEGDLDSAVTMLMMKSLTEEKPWMANPILNPDGTVTFAHCTAPLFVHGAARPFSLLCHHETGVGASPSVEYAPGETLTLMRYAGEENTLGVHTGVSAAAAPRPTCRTQLTVRLDDPAHFLEVLPGCHQVLAFADLAGEARRLARLLGVRVL